MYNKSDKSGYWTSAGNKCYSFMNNGDPTDLYLSFESFDECYSNLDADFPVTQGENCYIYGEGATLTVTFYMDSGKLVRIERSDTDNAKFDGTYSRPGK